MATKMTYESICTKLGFDPQVNHPEPEAKDEWLIDDNYSSPYSALSSEELDFIIDVLLHRN